MAMDDLTRRHLLAGLGALGLGGCGKSRAPAAPAARRLVTVGGAITEIVYALGLGGEVVAADTSSIFPPEATKLPQVGYQRALSAEGVMALKPTLVLASHDAGPPVALEQIKAAGVEVVVIPGPPTIEGAQAKVRAVGQRLGRTSEAEALAARIAREAAPGLALAKAAT
ncbi:MAG: hemin ABC transporter substrate-binding protein, partial [Myxococcales bacterium]